jgi:hypothetical protein
MRPSSQNFTVKAMSIHACARCPAVPGCLQAPEAPTPAAAAEPSSAQQAAAAAAEPSEEGPQAAAGAGEASAAGAAAGAGEGSDQDQAGDASVEVRAPRSCTCVPDGAAWSWLLH